MAKPHRKDVTTMAKTIRLNDKRLIAKYGDIEIDPTEFKISEFHDQCLEYIGGEIDGSRISLPKGIKSMDHLFSGCEIMTPPVIPDSVTNMDNAFSSCYDLIEPPIIPNGVTSMLGTFEDCASLTKAPIIPDGVKNMDGTFMRCSRLIKAPAIPDSVTSMIGTFEGCDSLIETPDIPKGVKNVSDDAPVVTNPKGVNYPLPIEAGACYYPVIQTVS